RSRDLGFRAGGRALQRGGDVPALVEAVAVAIAEDAQGRPVGEEDFALAEEDDGLRQRVERLADDLGNRLRRRGGSLGRRLACTGGRGLRCGRTRLRARALDGGG